MHIALFAGLMGMLVFTVAEDRAVKYDEPVPQVCATFQDRYDVANKAFCDEWMAAHVVNGKAVVTEPKA